MRAARLHRPRHHVQLYISPIRLILLNPTSTKAGSHALTGKPIFKVLTAFKVMKDTLPVNLTKFALVE